MTNPEKGNNNPSTVRAVYEALMHSPIPSSALSSRRAHESRRYTLSHRTTLTTTQGSLYFYLENLTNDNVSIDTEHFNLYSGGEVDLSVYHNANVDTGTFNNLNIINTDTASSYTPDANAYVGTNNNVTITSKGNVVLEGIQGANKKTFGFEQSKFGVIRPGDSILIEVKNTTSSGIRIALTLWLMDSIKDQYPLD